MWVNVCECMRVNLDGTEPMRLVLLKLSGDFFFEDYRKYRNSGPFIIRRGQNIICI